MPFRAFTITSPGRERKVITQVSVYPAFDPAADPPHPAGIVTKGLWDTGATGSMISKPLAEKLALVPMGAANVGGATGSGVRPLYIVNFMLPNGVGVPAVSVTEGPDFGDFDVLIGMDIITLGDFALTHLNGQTCMSFRVPSYGRIDYVTEHNGIVKRTVGPNEPCPCNSGKKFKHCHRDKLGKRL